ncbi:hypothetical protein GCM10009000_077280 [Halobacterium noricense]|uniref:Right handed beta helix domain-containing protein n=2 Tax=Haladaptatus pallidirubidus TaxID=1008152 RepID=A0AAV3UP92_9EURY
MKPSKTQSSNQRTDTEIITTRTQLETAFDELTPGDTIEISDKNAPYRTTKWLDIDVDGVTVVGPGVQNLIKPANGANVGGIRIGHHSRCHEIDIRGIGYYGNPSGQKKSANRLHGISIRNATNVTIERNQIRKTHPKKHGNGGSGISVTPKCSDIRISNNQIHDFGDRGIQLGGKRLTVFGNVVTRGLDRPIACDLWYPGSNNSTAQSVSIFGNLLGNSAEGSLIGVARNTPLKTNKGYVNIFGNVGFGSHKSFCHIRGPEKLQNISVQNNVSTQKSDGLKTEKTKQFAGIAVDVAKGENLAIKNNELYSYSGHGIHIKSEISDLAIQNNSIFSAGLVGVRLVDGTCGLVDNNLITGTTKTGIQLKNTSNIVIRGNYLRKIGTVGIKSSGSKSATDNDITSNYILCTKDNSKKTYPAIKIDDTENRVRGNTIRQNETVAIVESTNAGNNIYENNLADGDNPWEITSPTSIVRDHTPPAGTYRELSTGSNSKKRTIEFERRYAQLPRLTFGRGKTAIEDLSYRTDDDGDFTGVDITVSDEDTTIDLFVDDH